MGRCCFLCRCICCKCCRKCCQQGDEEAIEERKLTSSTETSPSDGIPIHKDGYEKRGNDYNVHFSSKERCSVTPKDADDTTREPLINNHPISRLDTTSKQTTYVALWDFTARQDNELSIKVSERVELINSDNEDWWYVRVCYSDREGYIPSNYVAAENSCRSEKWFFENVDRLEAERRLKVDSLPSGTFIIRNSGSVTGNFSLSIRFENNVRHYKINMSDTGFFSVDPLKLFPSLQDLVEHYQNNADGLVYHLVMPCPVEKPLTFLAKDVWEINRESISLTTKLGSGAFGDVHKGLWDGVTTVAVKVLKKGTMSPQEFIKEAAIMKKLRHKHLVHLYAVCSSHEPILIVTEYLCHGSLLEYLRKTTFTEATRIDMMFQVALGMEYLESQNYIHRDLAARNILVGENNICKVADFGLSRLIDDDEYYVAQEGARLPIKWLALESLLYRKFTTKSDVWSFGILMFEIITGGAIPYPGIANWEISDKINSGYRMSKPASCPPAIFGIISACWRKEPDDRPTFQNVRQDLENYFNDLSESDGNERYCND